MKELQIIQTVLIAKKNQYNAFGKYNYRNTEDILEALKPLQKEYKCIVTLTDEVEMLGDRFYIKAKATIINDKGQSISCYGMARESLTKKGMDDSQITGAASSYARKYALNGLFAIDDTKDDDTINKRTIEAEGYQTASKATSAQKKAYWSEFSSICEYQEVDSLELWQDLVKRNKGIHGIDYPAVLDKAAENRELSLVIDCVHGASRLHLGRLLGPAANRLTLLRGEADVSFGGIAPEPSSVNMQGVVKRLGDMKNRLKIGAIIDPDGDRIRFTDGSTEISMNQFGAMAYEFLHENKGLKGMVAKTVATSNMANSIAKKLGEEIFEPRVGFKEFKPVIGKALVMFEESDGISIIGHTPEKDAYIGLLLAIDMVLTKDSNLGEIKVQLEKNYGAFFPDRDGVEVSLKGSALHEALKKLEKYDVGSIVKVGSQEKVIQEVITIDGRKMIFEDDSWVMIRPSGTEPKVRFYVESRDPDGTDNLVKTARGMLTEAGLL